jgi:hypothetical protein
MEGQRSKIWAISAKLLLMRIPAKVDPGRTSVSLNTAHCLAGLAQSFQDKANLVA